MPSKNQSRPEIPISKENNLYFVDRSLVQFAKSYEPAAQAKHSAGQSTNTSGVSCSPSTAPGRSDRDR